MSDKRTKIFFITIITLILFMFVRGNIQANNRQKYAKTHGCTWQVVENGERGIEVCK